MEYRGGPIAKVSIWGIEINGDETLGEFRGNLRGGGVCAVVRV